MAKIPVTYVRVLVVVPHRREAYGQSLRDGRSIYIDYKERASFVPETEIRPGVALGGELILHRRRHEDALETYRLFSEEEVQMAYVQQALCTGQSTERASGA